MSRLLIWNAGSRNCCRTQIVRRNSWFDRVAPLATSPSFEGNESKQHSTAHHERSIHNSLSPKLPREVVAVGKSTLPVSRWLPASTCQQTGIYGFQSQLRFRLIVL